MQRGCRWHRPCDRQPRRCACRALQAAAARAGAGCTGQGGRRGSAAVEGRGWRRRLKHACNSIMSYMLRPWQSHLLVFGGWQTAANRAPCTSKFLLGAHTTIYAPVDPYQGRQSNLPEMMCPSAAVSAWHGDHSGQCTSGFAGCRDLMRRKVTQALQQESVRCRQCRHRWRHSNW